MPIGFMTEPLLGEETMVLLCMLLRRLFFEVLSFDLAIFFLSLTFSGFCLMILGDLVGNCWANFCFNAASTTFFFDSLSLERPPRSLLSFLL